MKPENIALHVPLQEAQLDAPQRDVAVTVLRQGLSRNGRYFTPQALQDVAAQLDGLKAFADHPAPADGSIPKPRSVRDVVGFYREPRLEGDRVRATLHIFGSADWLWSLVREAVALGRPDVLGLSIDSLASVRTQQHNGKSTQVVERIPALRSCDVVTRAAAGGAFEQVLADQDTRMAEAEEEELQEDQATNPANQGPQAGAQTAHAPQTEEVLMGETAATTVDSRLAEAEAKLACMTTLHERLDAAALPAAVKRKLRRRFEGETFTTAVLEQAIQDEDRDRACADRYCACRAWRRRGKGAPERGRHRREPGAGRCRSRLGAPAGRQGRCHG